MICDPTRNVVDLSFELVMGIKPPLFSFSFGGDSTIDCIAFECLHAIEK